MRTWCGSDTVKTLTAVRPDRAGTRWSTYASVVPARTIRDVKPEVRVVIGAGTATPGSTRALGKFTLPCVTALADKGFGSAISVPDQR
jgi:hypothetical protein